MAVDVGVVVAAARVRGLKAGRQEEECGVKKTLCKSQQAMGRMIAGQDIGISRSQLRSYRDQQSREERTSTASSLAQHRLFVSVLLVIEAPMGIFELAAEIPARIRRVKWLLWGFAPLVAVLQFAAADTSPMLGSADRIFTTGG